MLKKLVLSAIVLGLTACSAPQADKRGAPDAPSPNQPMEPSDPSRGPASIDDEGGDAGEGMFGLDDAAELEVVTDFLYPDDDYKPEDDEPPVGILLLSETQTAKNAFLCDGYLRELRTYEEAKAEAPDSDFLITYWPLETAPESFDSCDQLMAHYDYARAAEIRANYGLLEIEGPVVVAVDFAGDSVFLDLTDATAEASRDALKSWLSLALEESNVADTAPGAGDDNVESAHDMPSASDAGRLNLSSFTTKVKQKLLTGGGAGMIMSERRLGDGRLLYAYKDPDTGYSIGSTIRF